jgi:hypothetical protein
MGDSRGAYRVLVGRLEEKRPLGRSRCRLEDNIKMNLQRRQMGGSCTALIWLRIERGGGPS